MRICEYCNNEMSMVDSNKPEIDTYVEIYWCDTCKQTYQAIFEFSFMD